MASLSLRNIWKVLPGDVTAVKISTWRSRTRNSSSWSVPRAAASPPRCAWSPAWRRSPRANLYIDGKLVNNVLPKDRDIAMVFQSYALYPHMTVYNNMEHAI